MVKSNRNRNFQQENMSAKKTTSKTPVLTRSLSFETFLLLFFGISLLGVIFLQSEHFSWLRGSIVLPAGHLNLLLMLSGALIAAGFYQLPAFDPRIDLPRKFAYPILTVILSVAAYLMFYRIDQPVSCYWDDPAVCIIDPRKIVDFHDFHVLFPIGAREPFYPYAAAFVWWLVPTLKPLLVQRLTSNLIDLTALWIFYRLGREVSGKRLVGILFVAFAAASKPILLQNLSGMGGLTLIFGVALFLLFQIRLFKKPSLAHFLEWGAALGIGLSTYNAARAWVPCLAFITLGWILWQARKDKIQWSVRAILFLFTVGFMSFYLDTMLAVAHGNFVSKIWGSNFHVWMVLQIAFLGGAIYLYRISKDRDRQLCGWVLGLLITGILSYPLALFPMAVDRITSISVLPKTISGMFSMNTVHLMFVQINSAIKAFFVAGDDRADMNIPGNPFFDYHAVVWVLFGLAAMAARPSWLKLFFFSCAWIGIIPRLLTWDPTSAKMLGSAPPLFLLAAMGMGQWLESAWGDSWKKRWMGILLIMSLTAFWAWEIQGTYQKVYGQWWGMTRDDVRLAGEVYKDLPDKRVYIAPVAGFGFMSPAVQSVLLDGQDSYLLQKTNVIDVLPSESRKDVVVFISSHAVDLVALLKKEFPKAQWSSQWQYYQNLSKETPFLHRVLISSSQISEKPGKLFQYRAVPGKVWLRRFYATDFGLARGMIQKEDLSPTLNPPWFDSGGHSCLAEGVWEAPADGDYKFSIFTLNFVQLRVDGKTVLDFKPNPFAKNVSRTIFLKKGSHSVRYATFLKTLDFADVTIQNKTINLNQILGR